MLVAIQHNMQAMMRLHVVTKDFFRELSRAAEEGQLVVYPSEEELELGFHWQDFPGGQDTQPEGGTPSSRA